MGTNRAIKIVTLALLLLLGACKEKATDVEVGASFSCATRDGAVSCWGMSMRQDPNGTSLIGNRFLTKHQYNDPIVSAGGFHYCVLDQNEVECFINNENGQLDVPDLINPYEIAVGLDFSCALDETGLVCWGDTRVLEGDIPANLVNPRQLETGFGHFCLIDDYGTHCGGFTWSGNGDPNPPENFNPTKLNGAAWSYNICGFDEVWKCWGAGDDKELPESMQYAENVEPGYITACSLDNGEIECWEPYRSSYVGSVEVPENITRVFLK